MKASGGEVTIMSKSYDGQTKRSWACRLIEQNGPQLLFVGEFDRDVEHPDLGLIKAGTVSYEYYWTDRWYNIFRFHEPTGELRNFYCNVNMPPTFADGLLEYVDLDLDLLVMPDLRYKILDREEFELNATRFNYPESVRWGAESALSELVGIVTSGGLPVT